MIPLRSNPVRSMCSQPVYYARTLNISGLKKDEKIPIRLIIDDSMYTIHIRFLGKEIIENRDGNKYRCVKFAAKMIQGTIFRGEEDVVVWVTDDDNRIPFTSKQRSLLEA